MSKWKIAFFVSLALNVITITGFFAFRHYMAKGMFQLVHMSHENKLIFEKDILKRLQSDDPNNIENLKEYLKKSINFDTQAVENARQFVK